MAKVEPRRIAAVLADPGPARAVLLHGDDAGLARERAEALVRSVAGGDDPFRYAELSREAAARPGALADEAASLAMTGGRRLVRVREATDALAAGVAEALRVRGTTLLLLEAGELRPNSKLRTALEAAPEAAVIGCYAEQGAERVASVERLLREQGVGCDRAAAEWLGERLGEDRMQLRRALEVVALYVGPGGRVTEASAAACVDGGRSLDVDEAVLAALAGEAPAADAGLATVLAEGGAPVMVLRAALRHVQRLHGLALTVAGGEPAGAALDGLRPRPFFRHRPALERALRRWRPEALERAGAALLEAERRTKTGAYAAADAALAHAAVLALARGPGAR